MIDSAYQDVRNFPGHKRSSKQQPHYFQVDRSRMNYSVGKHNLPEVYRAMMYVSVVSLTFWLLVGVSFKNYVKVLLNYLKCVMFGFVCRL